MTEQNEASHTESAPAPLLDLAQRDNLNRAWFSAVKVGDYMYRINYRHWHLAERVEVTKLTKTQIVLSDGARINRETRRIVGESPYRNRFYAPGIAHVEADIAADKARIDLQRAVDKLENRFKNALRNGKIDRMSRVEDFNALLDLMGAE